MYRRFGELAGIESPDWVTRSGSTLPGWAEVADHQRNIRARHHQVDQARGRPAGHDDASRHLYRSVHLAAFRHARWLTLIGRAGPDRLDRPSDLLPGAADAPARFPLSVVPGEVEPSLAQPGWIGCIRASQPAEDPAGLATANGREVRLAGRRRRLLEEMPGVQEHAGETVGPGRARRPLSRGHEHDDSSIPAGSARSPRLQECRNAPVIAEHPAEFADASSGIRQRHTGPAAAAARQARHQVRAGSHSLTVRRARGGVRAGP
jgi:hypothetical protein